MTLSIHSRSVSAFNIDTNIVVIAKIELKRIIIITKIIIYLKLILERKGDVVL